MKYWQINENKLVTALLKKIRKEWLTCKVLKHADKITSGVPDISVTARKKTSWWEVKWAEPLIDTPGIQYATCSQLAAYGDCWYVIYGRDNDGEFTAIAPPSGVDFRSGTFVSYRRTDGIDHDFVLAAMRRLHFGQEI